MTKSAFHLVVDQRIIGISLMAFALMGLTCSTSARADDIAFTAPLETLSQLTERPLFSTTRRGRDTSVQTPAPVESAPALPLEGVLLGLAKSDDESGFALIRFNDEAEPVKIQIGDVIRGWQLIGIDNHTATFTKDGQTVSLAFP